MNKIIKLHFSPNGGTKAAVDGLAAGVLSKEIVEIDMTLPANRNMDWTFKESDLVLVGMPVYSGRLPAISAEIFKKLEGNKAKTIAIASYGNRHYDDALLELTNELDTKGFRVVAAGAVIAEHCLETSVAAKRPDANDQVKLREVATQVVAKLQAEKYEQPVVPGHLPYRDLKATPTPTGNDTCDQCGLCAKNCPTEAIDFLDGRITDPDLCIYCARCINICPKGARSTEKLAGTKQWLIENCSERREMEWFL
jgi:ferredoxin